MGGLEAGGDGNGMQRSGQEQEGKEYWEKQMGMWRHFQGEKKTRAMEMSLLLIVFYLFSIKYYNPVQFPSVLSA